MREFIAWIIAGGILTGSALHVCASLPDDTRLATIVEGVDMPLAVVVVPYAASPPAPPEIDYRDWCEPVDAPMCRTSADCTAAPDGTPRVCTREWWVDGSEAHVCVSRAPRRGVQQWRSDRLRVLVDAICQRRDGCDPEQLHDYLAVLALRESSWRPYVVHRLEGDREAALVSWRRMADHYVDSPAHGEPQRWVSRGYFGQNPALLLERWDATAVPEVLCGEVESTLVHLRVARDRLRRLERGVTCDGEEHHGTADDHGPSWYDVSRANAGSDACPGKAGHALAVRRSFETRALARGLDPYGAVHSAMLGREVDRAEQDAFARRVRASMDALPRP